MKLFDLFCCTGAVGVGKSGVFLVCFGCGGAAGGFGAGEFGCSTVV